MESQVGIADGRVRRRAGRPGRADRRARRHTARSSPSQTVESLGRPAAGRPAAPARGAHPRRVRGAARGRRAGPVRVRRGAGPPARRRAATSGRSRSGGRRPTWRSARRTTSRWSGSTWPRSPRGRWPSGCTSGSPGTGWPAPGSASRRCTAHGEELHRVWRHDGLLTAAAIADRVRWQLDGWLTGTARRRRPRHRPGRPPASSGCAWSPTGVVAHAGAAAGPVGRDGRGAGAGAPGAEPGAGHARPGGGGHRGARRRAAHRPIRCGWCRGATSGHRPAGASRPGRVGSRRPPPPLVLPEPLPATVRDATGAPVGVSAPARGHRAAGPARGGHRPAGGDRRLGRAVAGRRAVVGARRGPPPRAVPGRPGRRQRALLLFLTAGRWAVEAIYD